MISLRNIFLLFAISFFTSLSGANRISDIPREPSSSRVFTENKGQMKDMNGVAVPFVLFKTESPGLNMFITEKGLTYLFFKAEDEGKEKKNKREDALGAEDEEIEFEWNRVDVLLKGANIKKENVITEGKSKYFRQFFLAHCPNGVGKVHDYEKIIIQEIYPGIDWVLYNSNEKGVKYDFIVHPNADPKDIELIYLSKKPIIVNQKGEIEITTALGEIKENAPVSLMNGVEISSKFEQNYRKKINVNENNGYETSITFDFSGADLTSRSSDLIVDPQLVWATFFGGSALDGPLNLCNDLQGNVFTSGYETSLNFPVQNNSTFFQGTINGASDAFIMKFSNTGVLIWSTYYGGSGNDTPNNSGCDANGNLFVTGGTFSTDFPVQNSGTFFQANNSGAVDAFILKFDNSGNRLWATYYGGNIDDQAFSLAIDSSGNLFICGNSTSANFPVQNSSTFFQGTNAGAGDAFILKFDNFGNRLWATNYGGSANDQASSITVDGNGKVFVAGYTYSTNFPLQNAGTFFQSSHNGTVDLFILKFDNSGNRLWATYYGGSFGEWPYSVVADLNGNIFISGYTNSVNFPLQNAGTYFQGTFGGGWDDIYILKFDNIGNRLWATYFGGNNNDEISIYDNLAIDPCNNVYMAFATSSSNMPVLSSCGTCFFNPTYNNSFQENFITKFSNNGTLTWATYFGGVSSGGYREATTCDNSGNLFMAGEWIGTSAYPVVNPGGGAYYNPNQIGVDDGYIAKFLSQNTPTNYTASICPGSSTVISVYNSCLSNVTYSILPGAYTQSNPLFTVTPSATTTYSLFISGLNNNAVITQSAIVTVSVNPGPVVAPSLINGTCANPITNSINLNVTFNPSGSPNYTVNWSPVPAAVTAVNSGTATGLIPGANTISITTSNGCVLTYSFNVPPVPLPANFILVNPNNDYTITCINPNVVLTTSITNGVPLTYTWYPSCTGSVVSTSMNFSQVCIGQVVGTSSTGCQITQTFTIYQDLSSPTLAISPTVNIVNCSSGGACFTLTSNMGANVTTNWFQIQGTNTVYVGAAQGTINIFCAGNPGIYWGESINNLTGCKMTQSVQATASIGVPAFTVTSPTNFTIGCSSKSITSMQVSTVITSPVLNTPVNYAFMIPPVTTTPTTFTANPNLNNIIIPGTYVVYIKDLTNNCVSSQSISIIQNTISPNVNFIQPLSILTCKDPSMALNGISSNTNTSITWTVPSIPSNSINPTPNATVVIKPAMISASDNITTLGTWTVGAVDNNNYCIATKTVQIMQDVRLPKFTISALSNSIINCKNADVLIVPITTPTLAVALVPTFVWYPPIGNSLPGSQFNTTAAGSHTAISTSVVNGCTTSATYIVASDHASPIVNLSSPFILDCNTNPTVVITPSISSSITGFTYSWTVPPGALTSDLHGMNLTSNIIGNYFVTITNTINGCSSQGLYQVTEGSIKADFIADPFYGFAPLNVTFTNTSATSTGNSSITSTWGFGNGSITQNIPNNIVTTVTYEAPGTYSVILTVQKGTCISQIIKTIEVSIKSKLDIPNVFTPNNDGVNDVFRLKASSLKEVYVIIFDRWGNKVYELTSDTGNFSWDGKNQIEKNCDDGVYLYVIKATGMDGHIFESKGNVSLFR